MNFRLFGLFASLVLAVSTLIAAPVPPKGAGDRSRAVMSSSPRAALWKEVADAENKRLPQTAIAVLTRIEAEAREAGDDVECFRAFVERINHETALDGTYAEGRIIRLKAALDKAPARLRPLAQALLGSWYFEFYQQNRWQFLGRTKLDAPEGTDINTWSLSRILSEIDRCFEAAFADEATLKATPISVGNGFLTAGSVPDDRRPTLFDFVAHQALAFYTLGEQGASSGEEVFILEASGPVFGDIPAFLAWKPAELEGPVSFDSSAKVASTLRALGLFQRLLAFHQGDKDPTALLYADLARLEFAQATAVGEDKTQRYRDALSRFIEANAKHEVSVLAMARLARLMVEADETAAAHALALRGRDAFLSCPHSDLCQAVLVELETRQLDVSSEKVWNAPWPTLDVRYRNIDKVHFRLVALTIDEAVERSQWSPLDFSRDHARSFAGRPAAREWTATLAQPGDYGWHTASLEVPTDLKAGLYVLIASGSPDFGTSNNCLACSPVWVSKLSLLTRSGNKDRLRGGLLVRADSGEPVADAKVRVWRRDEGNSSREPRYREIDTVQTDAEGCFELPEDEGSFIVAASSGDEVISSVEQLFAGKEHAEKGDSKTVFFLDRAIYRPGQMVHYKGISLRHNREVSRYSAIGGLDLVIELRDANGEVVERAKHTTNAYGSFSGTFTVPVGRGTGQMSLQVENRPSSQSFRVEEYKRPKFQVEVPAPSVAAKLGEVVTLQGRAVAYTGAPVGGAKVRWRVERSVRLPFWCWWFRPEAPTAIAHGLAFTEADGSFKVSFTALPDRSVAEKDDPVFTYVLSADVTDGTGETRSAARYLRVGYTALALTASADPWQVSGKPVELSLRAATLDGATLSAKGVVRVYALRQPDAVPRALLKAPQSHFKGSLANGRGRWVLPPPTPDPANPEAWEAGDQVWSSEFSVDDSGRTKLLVPLQAGIYRAVVESTDAFGKSVSTRTTLRVLDPAARACALRVPSLFAAPTWSAEVGTTFTALWGTGYTSGRALVEVECNGRLVARGWTQPGRTQEPITVKITEALRGGFTVRVTSVRENRAYLESRQVLVPWSDRKLNVIWETFRSALQPGQKETWTAVVKGPDAKAASAEFVATLYDASLDQFATQAWPAQFDVFRGEQWSAGGFHFQNDHRPLRLVSSWEARHFSVRPEVYRGFPSFEQRLRRAKMLGETVTLSAFEVAADKGYGAAAPAAASFSRGSAASFKAVNSLAGAAAVPPPAGISSGTVSVESAAQQPALDAVATRSNFNETAFFMPHLLTDSDGKVRMTFTMPESLTEWRFLGFAHDAQLRAGVLSGKAVTSKDLMVEVNPPRFVREGDVVEFTAKVTNRTKAPLKGKVRLTFTDLITEASADAKLGNLTPEQVFEVPAESTRSHSWRVTVVDGLGVLAYKAVAATEAFSDGEEAPVPVLSRRVLVTESMPLPLRGAGKREFEFGRLLESGKSDTLRHQSLTVQMVSQPAWYAVMAMPYLMEFPHECSEQIFSRYYANVLGSHLAASNPKIRKVFDAWKAEPGVLDSPLEKNQQLKSVLIEETPWLRTARAEGEARRNVGLLFDETRTRIEAEGALRKLAERQTASGLWSWFPGGEPSEFISLHLATGFARLRALGVKVDMDPALRSLPGLDSSFVRRQRDILKGEHPERYVPGATDALYLYGRSFFLEDAPLSKEALEAVDFLKARAREHWNKVESRMTLGHLALGLNRLEEKQVAGEIMASLRERAVNDAEMGMHWLDKGESWWWWRAPIETQALMIEAFSEVAKDAQSVEALKVWLLKQKQVQAWKSTKATTDAVYALLKVGADTLASDAIVEVSLAGVPVKPSAVEAGTGFYEKRFAAAEISAAQGRVTTTKSDAGVSWGSVHWQYLEDLSKVPAFEGTPLKLTKTLYVRDTTSKGRVLRPVTGPVSVGDELIVRLELRVDRDMEYVHLKDQRGSGTEPVNVLSRYRWQDGLGYFESTRDTASHFFIERLPRGTYVFEYPIRVQLRGSYQSGVAEIQCMYAPEFNSHSGSVLIEAR